MAEPVEMYRKHRPKAFKHVVGQDKVVKQLETMLKNKTLPHTICFTGGSGVGKTTLGWILKHKLGCGDNDYEEINCANTRGIDTVREIAETMPLAPMSGSCRIWFLDEAHQLLGATQSALLKMLEEPPSHVYFLIATTHPDKLLPTIRTRCTTFKLASLTDEDLKTVLNRILEVESKSLSSEVLDKIIEASHGSARQAVVNLHQVMQFDLKSDQLDAISHDEARAQAFDIVKALLWQQTKWDGVVKILKNVDWETDNIERLRQYVLACASTEMLKANNNAKRAYLVINAFEADFFRSGRAGFLRACYEVLS